MRVFCLLWLAQVAVAKAPSHQIGHGQQEPLMG